LGAAYNLDENGDKLRGFSPLCGRPRNSSNEFLILCTRLFDVGFAAEKNKLVWNDAQLNRSVEYLRDWVELNGGYQNEEDFIYKYFFNHAHKLIASGRIRFACMESSEFFLSPPVEAAVGAGVGEDSFTGEFDFRWLSKDGGIPVSEDAVFLGIHKKSYVKNICYDFVRWFFTSETQNLLLEESRKAHLNESVFGIAGGFSSLPEVNESVFPKYYESVLGHLPSGEALRPAAPTPAAWREIKDGVLIPFMLNAMRQGSGDTKENFNERLRAWQDIQHNTFK
jgi:hypothetical protein